MLQYQKYGSTVRLKMMNSTYTRNLQCNAMRSHICSHNCCSFFSNIEVLFKFFFQRIQEAYDRANERCLLYINFQLNFQLLL